MVLAAIAEYTDGEPEVALKTFQPLFGSARAADGTTVVFGSQQLKEAGKLLSKMIQSGKIAVKPVTGGAAGAWTPDITGGVLTGGTFEVGDWKTIKQIGRSSRNFSQLQKQDQFANTLLHETGHMFYSVFTLAFGFAPQSQPSVPTDFRSYFFWNSTRPIGLCTSEGCPYPHAKGACRGDDCYAWSITNAHYGQGNATEYAARVISQEMCDASNCTAYARVLAPAFN